MERMINDRLVWFLESNNLISGNQAGFRKHYSTNDHLVRLESFIRDAFIIYFYSRLDAICPIEVERL